MILLDSGRFVVVHSFVYMQLSGTITQWKLQIWQNLRFLPLMGDRIYRFRWNLACKCRPWVCSSMPNLSVITNQLRGLGTGAPWYFLNWSIYCFWSHRDHIIYQSWWNLVHSCQILEYLGSWWVQEPPNLKIWWKSFFLAFLPFIGDRILVYQSHWSLAWKRVQI